MFAQAEPIDNGRIAVMTPASSDSGVMRFHAIWLRDNAPDAETKSPQNGQRLITLEDIPEDVAITGIELDGNHVAITFNDRPTPVVFDAAWLAAHCYDKEATTDSIWVNPNLKTWGSEATLPCGDYEAVCKDDGAKLAWLEALNRFGVARLKGGPVESGALIKVAELFGYVRETNYGKWFDVKTEVNPVNLAFTGLSLKAHTDNPYRDPVPTMQILYCLENAAEGGDNVVVDGFACVEKLKQTDPDSVELLAKYCARFEYSGSSDVVLKSKRPMVELAPDGELMAVRFNNRSAGAFIDVPFDDMAEFYQAYRKLSALIEDPAMQVSFKLQAGEAFVVDNTRVLHARKGYTAEGHRWLQGCYPDKDGLLSTIAALKDKPNTIGTA